MGLPLDFTVMDQADAADLMNLIRGELRLDARRRRFPRKETLAAIYSRTVNAGQRLEEVLSHHFPWCAEEREDIGSIFRRYTERKRDHHVLDYDDLLLYWAALLRSRAGERVAASFDHVLVDEYQDTNGRQAEILRLLAPAPPGVERRHRAGQGAAREDAVVGARGEAATDARDLRRRAGPERR